MSSNPEPRFLGETGVLKRSAVSSNRVDPTPAASLPFRKKYGGLILLALGAALLVGLMAWRWRPTSLPRTTEEDPRSSYASPFKNVRPGVGYVGDEACTSCHAGIAESYRQHPMGQSLFPIAQAPPLEGYGEEHSNPFERQGLRYFVEQRDGQVIHRETRLDASGNKVMEKAEAVHYAIGSGIRGRTYLIERDGFLSESPISWYTQKARWDLSPGYQKRNRHFERQVLPDCLFCHCNQVRPVAGTINRYETPTFRGHTIGCERCHGPGELHVRRREREEGVDVSIVNPRHLEPALRDSVCEQCHLQGEARVVRLGRELFDYRPGLPLHLFISAFVRLPEFTDNHKAISHPEQMRVSRCYQASKGKLGCISCHDPHRLPAADERVAFFRDRCLACHQDQGCSLPEPERLRRNREDSCIACHMPKAESDIVHVSQTDHRVRRRPLEESREPAQTPRDFRAGEIPLLHFHQHLIDAKDRSASRDLGVALVVQARKSPGGGTSAWLARLALPVMESSAGRWPDDVPTLEAYAYARWQSGRKQEAADAYQAALLKAPRRESMITDYVDLLAETGRPDEAIRLLKRAIEIDPYPWRYHNSLATLHAQEGQWAEAISACKDALRRNPAALDTRRRLVECLLKQGDRKEAEAEFKLLLDFDPPDKEELERWWAERK